MFNKLLDFVGLQQKPKKKEQYRVMRKPQFNIVQSNKNKEIDEEKLKASYFTIGNVSNLVDLQQQKLQEYENNNKQLNAMFHNELSKSPVKKQQKKNILNNITKFMNNKSESENIIQLQIDANTKMTMYEYKYIMFQNKKPPNLDVAIGQFSTAYKIKADGHCFYRSVYFGILHDIFKFYSSNDLGRDLLNDILQKAKDVDTMILNNQQAQQHKQTIQDEMNYKFSCTQNFYFHTNIKRYFDQILEKETDTEKFKEFSRLSNYYMFDTLMSNLFRFITFDNVNLCEDPNKEQLKQNALIEWGDTSSAKILTEKFKDYIIINTYSMDIHSKTHKYYIQMHGVLRQTPIKKDRRLDKMININLYFNGIDHYDLMVFE